MKTFKLFAILLVIAAVLFFIVKKPGTQPVVNNDAAGGTMLEGSEYLCYVWNTEAGDNASLRITVVPGGDATGTFDWVPAEKDSKRGSFEGVAYATDEEGIKRLMKGWWKASAEGNTTTEELHIRFDEKTAAAGSGEMKAGPDGTYVYANPDNLSYAPTLMRTDCGDEALI